MKVDALLFERFATLLADQNPLGNCIFVPEGGEFFFLWDIPFETGTEAILFQRLFLVTIGSIYNQITGIHANVGDGKIVVCVEDDSQTIIRPTTTFATSMVHSFGNHFKGQISFNPKLITFEPQEFAEKIEDVFYDTLNEITLASIRI